MLVFRGYAKASPGAQAHIALKGQKGQKGEKTLLGFLYFGVEGLTGV